MSQPKAVITGAAGFIGAALGRVLVGQGFQVMGIDNERSGDWTRVGDIERVDADIAELTAEQWAQLLADSDVVFHLAAEKYNSSKSSPDRVVETNVAAMVRMLAGIRTAAVPKVVFTSSLYAYGSMGPLPMKESDIPEPDTYYGMSKVAGELMLRAAQRDFGLHWSVARLMFVYGPRQWAAGGYKSVIMTNFERMLRGEEPVINGDGLQELDYVFIDDVVDALLSLAQPKNDFRLCNIGSGAGTSVNDLTEAMMRIAGYHGEPRFAPPDWTAGSSRVGDVSRAAHDLGWRPKTALDTGLTNVWSWLTGAKT